MNNEAVQTHLATVRARRGRARTSPLALLACSLVLIPASPKAYTTFPAQGGQGDAAFEDRCPAGKYLLGLQGRAGDWVDQVQLVCARLVAGHPGGRGAPPEYYRNFPDREPYYYGPGRGGAGGAPAKAGCAAEALVVGAQMIMTEGNRQVKYVDLKCRSLNGNQEVDSRFNKSADPSTNISRANSRPTYQGCPTGEAGVGFSGRYGQHVNALGLICAEVVLPTPSPDKR